MPTAIAFWPEDDLVVSGGGDSLVIIWSAVEGKAVGSPLRGHEGSITAVAVSPVGTHFASADDKGLIRIWPAPPLWPQVLCGKLMRNMSRQEWAEWVSPALEYVVLCPGLPVPLGEPRKGSDTSKPN